MIEAGIPDSRNALPLPLREYYPFRDQLSTADGVAIFKDQIVIPPSLRQDILTALHAAHQGVTSMTSRAETSGFLPGITSVLETTATTVTAWPPLSQMLLQCPWFTLYTHSSVYVRTFSIIKVVTTWSL